MLQRKAIAGLLALAFAGCGNSTTTTEPDEVGGVPISAAALFQWLEDGGYAGWESESARHPSGGPHPVTVRAYLNDVLDASLNMRNARHPVGAAAVKELFSTAGTLSGWAVMVKVRDDRQDGAAWYWYEVTSRDPSRRNNPDFEGIGLGLCSGCHSTGRDFIRITHPLQ